MTIPCVCVVAFIAVGTIFEFPAKSAIVLADLPLRYSVVARTLSKQATNNNNCEH